MSDEQQWVRLPLATARHVEDALRFTHAHHAAPESLQQVAFEAWQDMRRHWQWDTAPEGEARA